MAPLATQLSNILGAQSKAVRIAYLKGVASINNSASLAKIEAALASGNIDAVLSAVGIEDAAFNDLRAELLKTYGNSGDEVIKATKWIYPNGQKAVVRYNSLSPRVEAYARNEIGGLITGISNEAIEGVRGVVADGYALGRSRNRIATDLIGRLGPDGKRIGGIVGLSDQQIGWRNNMRMWLENDPMRALSYTKRDRRFDKLIKSAVKDGKPLTKDQIDRIVRQYSDKLLKSRALIISRTETSKAIEEGKYEAWKQGLEKTGVPERFVIRTWNHHGRGMKDRPTHVMMHGRQMRGLTLPFVLPSGVAMITPHDTTYGAGPEELINCDCGCDYSIDRKGLALWQG